MKWEKGRQGTGYEKLKIFQFLNIDCYLLRYKVGDSIPWHVDPVPGYRHWRLNVTLKEAVEGGEVLHKLPDHNFAEVQEDRVVIFRSDLVEHCVSKIYKGKRIVLTFGIAI